MQNHKPYIKKSYNNGGIMVNLTKEEYQTMKKRGFRTNESYIYQNPKNRNKIIKIIKNFKDDPDFIHIKMHTINLLLESKDILKRINVAIPEEIVKIDGVDSGFEARRIKGPNLDLILADPQIKIETKIDYIKQIGTILRQMSEIRKNTQLKNLFYVDLHEGNFMVENGIVYGIDPDSFSILDNIATSGYYSGELYDLFPSSKKYQFCDLISPNTTDVIPDENLDLYCYIRIILNFMYGMEIENLTKDKLSDYLNFLELCKANLEFLYALECIYDDSRDNVNPDYLLDSIKEIYQYANINYDKTGMLRRILK